MELKGTFSTIEDGVKFVEEKLYNLKVQNKESTQAAVFVEHALYHLLDVADEKADINILIRKTVLFTDIRVDVAGKKIDLDEECEKEGHDADYAKVIAKTFHKSFHNIVSYKHFRGINRITIPVEESSSKELAVTLGALALGVVFGLICKLALSEKICGIIDYYVLDLLKTIFMNALKVIVGPVVFFAIAGCISRYTNLKVLGRIGVKTMVLYLFTTLVAMTIGFALYSVHPIGNSGMLVTEESEYEEDSEEAEELAEMMENREDADFSIRNMIVSIVPDNIGRAFFDVNLLQIIFLALIVGIAVGRCGESAVFLNNFIVAFQRLFTSITGIVTKFIPVAIFCSMAELVMNTGVETLLTLLSYAVLVVGGMICMIIFYCLFILVTTGLNPIIFLKKFSKAMMTAFAVSSGPATMPTSLSCCKKMGINDAVSSFTIPLGTNINMDGSCMVFVITVLFMCRIYGIEMTGGMMISVFVSIIFLALGSPTVAGADLVIIAVLLEQVGVPIEAIGLILGIDAIFDMVQAVSNTTGDAAVTLVVAKSEKMLDIEQYKS